MTHHSDHYADIARLRHAEHVRAAQRRPVADVVVEDRRSRLSALRRFFVRRPVDPVYVREFRVT